MVQLLLSLGFFLQCVLNDLASDAFRLIPFVFFFSAAAVCFLKRQDTNFIFSLGLIDFIFLLFIFSACVNFLIDFELTPVLYSLLFVIVIYSIFYCLVSIGVVRFFSSFVFGLLAAFIVAVISDPYGLIDALMVVRNETGLLRYMALGAHPNLVGHNFAIGALAAFWLALGAMSTRLRMFFLISGFVLLILPVAASSRGAIVSFFVSILCISFYFYFIDDGNLRVVLFVRRMLPIAAVLVAVLVVVNFEYIWDLFELGTSSRGLDSGMSGRGDNWILVVQDIFETPRNLLIGAGFRTWDDDLKGYATDNSYLNLAWEIGIPITVFAVLVFLKLLFKLLSLKYSPIAILGISLVSYMLVEGMVARYFFGMGNPATCVFLALALLVERFIKFGRV